MNPLQVSLMQPNWDKACENHWHAKITIRRDVEDEHVVQHWVLRSWTGNTWLLYNNAGVWCA